VAKSEHSIEFILMEEGGTKGRESFFLFLFFDERSQNCKTGDLGFCFLKRRKERAAQFLGAHV